MRLPTISGFKSQVFQISKQYERVTNLQIQATSAKKIQHGSEAPSLSLQVKSAENFTDKLKAYDLNLKRAESRVALSELAINNTENLLDRARSLVLRAKNATMTNADRATSAKELETISANLLDVSNTKDSNGEYIFSGMNGNQPAYVDENGTFSYKGSLSPTQIAISEGTEVIYNESGFRVFGDIKSGNGTFSIASDTVNNTGSGLLGTAKITNLSNVVKDTYTITMVTNSGGKLAYQVLGAVSGQVIPALPDAIPADAPEYVAGATINFNGISTELSGEPAAGDTFTITPSSRQNVFETLQNLITVLSTSTDSAKSRADFEQVVMEQFVSLSNVGDHLSDIHSEIGGRANVIDREMEFTSNRILEQDLLISHLGDADITETLSDLTKGLTILELTQRTYSTIQDSLNRLLTR